MVPPPPQERAEMEARRLVEVWLPGRRAVLEHD